jgi:hypothetical protein
MSEKKLEKLKFGPTRYVPWRFGIESHLKGKELWWNICVQNPQVVQANPAPEVKDAAAAPAAAAPAADILSKKDKAKHEIMSYLDYTYAVDVGALDDPIDILKAIEEANVPQTVEAIADMEDLLKNLKFTGGSAEQLCHHFTDMKAYRALLALAGVVQSDISWIRKLIDSVVVSEWETNITVLKSTAKSEKQVISKFNHLLSEKPVKRTSILNYEEKKEDEDKCFNCGATGHWKAECPKNKRRSGRNGGQGRGGRGGRGARGRGRGRGGHNQGRRVTFDRILMEVPGEVNFTPSMHLDVVTVGLWGSKRDPYTRILGRYRKSMIHEVDGRWLKFELGINDHELNILFGKGYVRAEYCFNNVLYSGNFYLSKIDGVHDFCICPEIAIVEDIESTPTVTNQSEDIVTPVSATDANKVDTVVTAPVESLDSVVDSDLVNNLLVEEFDTSESKVEIDQINSGVVCEKEWILDSGAGKHATGNVKLLNSLKEEVIKMILTNPNGSEMSSSHFGFAIIQGIRINGVKFVREMKVNVLSVAGLADKGCVVIFDKVQARVMYGKHVIMIFERRGNLYCHPIFEEKTDNDIIATAAPRMRTLHDWHQTLCHFGRQDVLRTMRKYGIGEDLEKQDFSCEDCLQGKMKRKPFRDAVEEKSHLQIGELVSSDAAGPFRIRSIEGSFYNFKNVEYVSGFIDISFGNQKSKADRNIKRFIFWIETQTGGRVKILLTDGGYTSNELADFLENKGIIHQVTDRHSPSTNGQVERLNFTIDGAVRTMFAQSGLPVMLWAYAMRYAATCHNTIIRRGKTDCPFTMLLGRPVDFYHHLLTFGQKVWYFAHEDNKLRSKAQPGFFINYDWMRRGSHIFTGKSVKFSRDVSFAHMILYKNVGVIRARGSNDNSTNDIGARKTTESIDDVLDAADGDAAAGDAAADGDAVVGDAAAGDAAVGDVGDAAAGDAADGDAVNEVKEPMVLRRSSRVSKPPSRLIDEITEQELERHLIGVLEGSTNIAEPSSWKDAVKQDIWIKSMNQEIAALERNSTWHPVPRPKDRRVIGSTWIFKVKTGAAGEFIKAKSRLCARGDQELSFLDNYSPVATGTSFKILMALKLKFKLHARQMDVPNAYLKNRLDMTEEIFMEIPSAYNEVMGTNLDVKTTVFKLDNYLYGLRRAGKMWNETLNRILQKLGFRRTRRDRCLYYLEEITQYGVCYLLVYVDDIVLVGTSVALRKFERELEREFEAKATELSYFLGVRIRSSDDGDILLDQEAYIDRLKERFQVQSFEKSYPFDPLRDYYDFEVKFVQRPYLEVIGSLMFLAVTTRPDLMYCVSFFSRFASKYNENHWKALLEILSYTVKTKAHALYLRVDGNLEIVAYSDADFAGDLETRHSTQGGIIYVDRVAVSWWSKLLKHVVLSSTEAEYGAGSYCCKEIFFVKELLEDLTGKSSVGIPLLFIDNRAAIAMANGPTRRSRHIEVSYHFLQECVENNYVRVEWVQSQDNQADILTKGFGRNKFAARLGLLPLADVHGPRGSDKHMVQNIVTRDNKD